MHLLQKNRLRLQLLLPKGAVNSHSSGIIANMVAQIEAGILPLSTVDRYPAQTRAAQGTHMRWRWPVWGDEARVFAACGIHTRILADRSEPSPVRIYNAGALLDKYPVLQILI
jgi:hypothetical protein